MTFEEYLVRPIARFTIAADVSFTNSENNDVKLDFPVQVVDSHNAVKRIQGGWRFYAPIAGWYRVSCSLVIFDAFISFYIGTTGGGKVNLTSRNVTGGWSEAATGTCLIFLKQGAEFETFINTRFRDRNVIAGDANANWIEVLYERA